jgi:phage terminase large subunit
MMRIEAVRRILPKCWFNADTTEPGRDALGYYHERRDPERLYGLGPEHDWSSNGADAFGYMAISYEEPPAAKSEKRGRSAEPPPRGTFWSA